ncbi:hypothetical protein Hdeb2414_s0004g00133401 [Helianthus debilis subsp. tardiflorus]
MLLMMKAVMVFDGAPARVRQGQHKSTLVNNLGLGSAVVRVFQEAGVRC